MIVMSLSVLACNMLPFRNASLERVTVLSSACLSMYVVRFKAPKGHSSRFGSFCIKQQDRKVSLRWCIIRVLGHMEKDYSESSFISYPSLSNSHGFEPSVCSMSYLDGYITVICLWSLMG